MQRSTLPAAPDLTSGTDRQGHGPPPDLGARGTARWAWRQLTSMRTALVLLLLLAVATIPGSLFPQRAVDRGAVNDYLEANPGSGEWLDRFGFFDVYASPWFAAVYLLLFVSLVGCIVPRGRAHAGDWRRRPPVTPRRLDRLPVHALVQVDEPVDVVLARVRAALARPGWRGGGGPLLGHVVDVHDETDRAAGAVSLAAETGRLRESGNLLFHVSLVGLLAGLAVSSLYAYRGEALVVEGESFSNVLPAYDSITPGARFDREGLPPFAFRLDDLAVAFEEEQASALGSPRGFEATLTVTDVASTVPTVSKVRVNAPLEVAGTGIYLTGNGYAPVIEVRDSDGELRWSGPVPFLPVDGGYTSEGVVKAPVPEGDDIALSGLFLPTAAGDPEQAPTSVFPDARLPRLVLTAWTGNIGLGDGTPQSVYELDRDEMTQLDGEDGAPAVLVLAPGESADLPGGRGTVTFVELPRFAAFQLRADPSGPLALVSAVLAMCGLVVSLFLPRRRVWVRISPATAHSAPPDAPPDAAPDAAPDADPDATPGVTGRGATAERSRRGSTVEVGALSRTRDTRLDDEVRRLLAAAGDLPDDADPTGASDGRPEQPA